LEETKKSRFRRYAHSS